MEPPEEVMDSEIMEKETKRNLYWAEDVSRMITAATTGIAPSLIKFEDVRAGFRDSLTYLWTRKISRASKIHTDGVGEVKLEWWSQIRKQLKNEMIAEYNKVRKTSVALEAIHEVFEEPKLKL